MLRFCSIFFDDVRLSPRVASCSLLLFRNMAHFEVLTLRQKLSAQRHAVTHISQTGYASAAPGHVKKSEHISAFGIQPS